MDLMMMIVIMTIIIIIIILFSSTRFMSVIIFPLLHFINFYSLLL
jgi:hypothetical protein